ncbi:MAG: iron ABC transporter permease [Flexilinea sp.]|nr:iron ABC transporter permease [Flexilinea sp.]
MQKTQKVHLILAAVIIGYLFASYLFPLFSIFKQTLAFGGNDFSLNMPLLVKTLRFTFKEALLSTAFTMAAGLLCAWVFSTYKFRGKRICMSIITVPFMLPTVVIAAGMNAWLGPKGVLNSSLMRVFSLDTAPLRVMNTFGIIIFTHVFYNTSLVLRMVGNSWKLIDKNIILAAENLGGRTKNIFIEIIFPLLKPSIISAALLTFLFDFTSYGVVLLMGGPKYKTLEVEISYQTLQVLDLKTAGVLSLIQMAITLLIVFWERRLKVGEIRFVKVKVFDENQRPVKSAVEKLIVTGIVGIVMLITVLPMFSLLFRSFYAPGSDVRGTGRGSGFSLIYYKSLFINERNSYFFVQPGKAILYSFLNAFYCSVIALIIGMMICALIKRSQFWHFLNSFILLPIGTSAVTLGLGYLIAYRRSLTSVWITPLAHSIVVLPFVIRTLQPAIEHMPSSMWQSAALLGAKPLDILKKIDLPILRRSIINSIIFSFTISMGEFGATSFLTRPERPTLPVAIYNYLSKPGGLNYGQAMAMSSILLVISIAAIFIISDD